MSEYNEDAIELYGENELSLGEHKVQGSVNLPLAEVDRLRGAIVKRDKVIDHYKSVHKKVEIRTYRMINREDRYGYRQDIIQDEITRHINMDDVIDALREKITIEYDNKYNGRIENISETRDYYIEKYENLKSIYSRLNDEYPKLLKELEQEKSKNGTIKEDMELLIKQNDEYVKDLKIAEERSGKLRLLLDDMSWWGKINRFFGIT